MELCTGGELLESFGKSKKDRISEYKAAIICRDLLGALIHIHKQKIIHRDIKPENIMLDHKDGTVKFIDFGLACQMSRGAKDIAGTPYYLAPEVLTGFYGYECDIWSLGVVLYQLLSGRMPFDAKTQEDLFDKIQSKNVHMPKHFSAELKDLLNQMLIKEPRKRIKPGDAIEHPWIKSAIAGEHHEVNDQAFDEVMDRLAGYHGKSKLKRAAINIMVKQMSEDQFADLREVFNKIDVDHSGIINKDELVQAMNQNHAKSMTKQQIEELIHNVDYMGNDKINYTEFLSATIDPRILEDEERIKGVFNLFDVDNSG